MKQKITYGLPQKNRVSLLTWYAGKAVRSTLDTCASRVGRVSQNLPVCGKACMIFNYVEDLIEIDNRSYTNKEEFVHVKKRVFLHMIRA